MTRIGLLALFAGLSMEFQTRAFAAPPQGKPSPSPSATPSRSPVPAPKAAPIPTVFWAKVYRGAPAGKRINQLKITNASKDGAWVKLVPVKDSKGGSRWVAELVLQYDQPFGSLASSRKELVLQKLKEKPVTFKVSVPMTEKIARVPLISILPTGAAENEEISIQVHEWEKVASFLAGNKSAKAPAPSTEQKSIGLGYTGISYTETGIDPVQAAGLTIKAGLVGDLTKLLRGGDRPSAWNWGLGAYYTLLPLSSTRPDAQLRFLGVNVRVGYLLPWPSSPWSMRLSTGYFYTTTMVGTSDPLNQFGFKNQMGPQLLLALGRGFKGGKQLSIYGKFAPLSDGFTALGMESREIATGFSYSWMLSGRTAMVLAVDLSLLKTELRGEVDGTTFASQIQSNTTSFSLGLNFM